jgi:hypothetical protein
MRNSLVKVSIVLVLGLMTTQVRLTAQDAAYMTGVVTDATGAVIPGTHVTLSTASTGVTFSQTTDNLGSYRFLNVPPNPGYKATFAHAGFETAEFTNITLIVGVTRTQNVRLTVGATSLTVQVSASNAIVTLDTSDASIGNNIDVQQLNELPVYDRSTGIATLFVQQPGVDSFQGAVTGARIDQSSVTVDGLDVNDVAAGTTFAIIGTAPVDSVQQFTGTVAGLVSSEGTGSGAGFQLVTKSGTNKFHGNLNEYHRDTTTEANTWFNNLNGIRRTPLIRNQFGGNIGGPIKRDKLFFFFDLADSKIVQSSTSEPTIPLSYFRSGTLNYINSSSSACGDSTRITSLTSLPACITTLSASDLAALDPASTGFDSSVISYISTRYPINSTANAAVDLSAGDGVNTVGYRFTYPTPDDRITYVGRVDYNLTPSQRIFGRFTITRRNAIESAPEFPTDPVTHPYIDHSYGYVVSHVWDIGKNKVNQFYYGDNISKLSFPDEFNPTGANQYSFSGLSGPYTGFDGQKRRVPIPVVRDDFNWQHGTHSITMGGSFKFIKTNSNLINNFNFVGAGLQGSALSGGLDADVRPSDIATGGPQNAGNVAINDYDNLFATGLGVIGTITTNFNYNNAGAALPAGTGGPRAYRFYETEMYVGDTWKVTKKLTLSYGLRYQIYSVPYEAKGDESVPITSPAGGIDLNTFINDRIAYDAAGNISNTGLPIYSYVLGGKANNGPNLYAPSYKDFAPRFAFAYTPFNNQKTVINGGAGIVYDRTVINAINFLQDQISYLFSNSNTNQFGAATVDESLATDTRLGANLSYPAAINPLPSPITSPYTPYVDGFGNPYGLAAGETSFVIDPKLKDPYSIALNFGVQQDIPGHMILKVNYVGRLGRRLLADVDANQVIDVPDFTGGSTQTMAGAFAGLTTQLRAGVGVGSLTPQPWFEDALGSGYQGIFGNNTNLVAAMIGQYGNRGDISDSLYTMAAYSYYFGFTGFLPTNIGIPSQFGTNAYLTNKGNSNYHALLLTLDKNISQGLRFEFNYTWSHSIDNTSLSANNNSLFSNTGFICDILQPRACRSSSDFDVRQEISSNFEYDLPFGRGKMFAANASRLLDEAIGGWSFSGLPVYRTGLALTPYSDAYLASFDNEDPAIFTGNKADLKTKVNVDYTTNTVYGFGGGAAGAAKVLAEFRGPIGLEYGQRNLVRGPGAFFLDAGLGKKFPILENKLNLQFRADAFNVFNHPNFGTLNLNIVTNASQFGQISGTNASPASMAAAVSSPYRVAQFSLRLEF